MARLKAICPNCKKTILLLFEDNSDDWIGVRDLKKGELFEHKCPVCDEWSAFEVAKD